MANRYGLDDCTILPHIDTPGVCNLCGADLTGRQTQWCSAKCQNQFRAEHDWNAARNAAVARDDHRCVRCGGDGRDARKDGWLKLQAPAARRWGIQIPWNHTVEVRAYCLPWLEVNHIVPRNGGGYHWGCWNHQSNLETLCHPCHVDETNRQAAERRGDPPPTQVDQLDLLELANQEAS